MTGINRDEICWRSGCRDGSARRSGARVYGCIIGLPIDDVVACLVCGVIWLVM